jgi:hypothetical protein
MKVSGLVACLSVAMAVPMAQGGAQQRGCLVPAPPFVLTAEKRLADGQILALLAAKRMVFTRRLYAEPQHDRRFSVFFRDDGSFVSRCERRAVGGGAWSECPSIDGRRTSGGREGGVWRVASGQLCIGRLRNQDEVCYAAYRDGGRIYLQLASGGPTCLPGEIAFR